MGNQNLPQNSNPNIQNIPAELVEPNISLVTRGGVASGADQEAPYRQIRVRLAQQNKGPFYFHKEKEVLLYARHEFVDGNQDQTSVVVPSEGPILDMPQRKNYLKINRQKLL